MKNRSSTEEKIKSPVKLYLETTLTKIDKELSANLALRLMTVYPAISFVRYAMNILQQCKTDEEIKLAMEEQLAYSKDAIGYPVFEKNIKQLESRIKNISVGFFKLPNVIKNQCISYLDPESLLDLSQASKDCHALFHGSTARKQILGDPKDYREIKCTEKKLVAPITACLDLPEDRMLYGLANGVLQIEAKDQKLCEFTEHKSAIIDCALSTDKNYLITCSNNGGIFIRDLRGKVIACQEDGPVPKRINKVLRDKTIAQVDCKEGVSLFSYDPVKKILVNKPMDLKDFNKSYGQRIANIECGPDNQYILGVFGGFWNWGGFVLINQKGKAGWILSTNSCVQANNFAVLSNDMIVGFDQQDSFKSKFYIKKKCRDSVFSLFTNDRDIVPNEFCSVRTPVVELPYLHVAFVESNSDWQGRGSDRRFVTSYCVSIFDARDRFKKIREIPLPEEVNKLTVTPEGNLFAFTESGKVISIEYGTLAPRLTLSEDSPTHIDHMTSSMLAAYL
ncbi:MAG: WD40 repeat domain-containing protein [Gammaproteobacteria bacterium]